MKIKKNSYADAGGTSFHYVTLVTTPAKLMEIAENHELEYEAFNDGDDKTNYDFTFELEDGTIFTVYDWKEYRSLDDNERVTWHVGGVDKIDCIKGKRVIESLL